MGSAAAIVPPAREPPNHRQRARAWRASAPGGEAFKVALHSAKRERGEFRPPSFLIHPGIPLEDRGIPNPYPDLRMFWVAERSAQGWSVSSMRQIPAVGPAIDLALEYRKS